MARWVRLTVGSALVATCGVAFGQTAYWEARAAKPVFSTREVPRLVVGFEGTAKFSFKVNYVSPQDYLSGSHLHVLLTHFVAAPKPKGKGTYTVADVTVPSARKPGYYSVTASVGRVSRNTTFWISDLGLVAKNTGSEALLWAVNRSDGTSSPSTSVIFRNEAGKEVGRRVTDSRGFLSVPMLPEATAAIARKGEHVAMLALGRTPDSREAKLYLYTDRPLYRPGQTVYIKGIARRIVDGEYVTAANESVQLRVRDANEFVLLEQPITANANGTFAAEVALPDEGAIGEYDIRAVIDGHASFAYFSVAEYRKPAYEVSVRMTPSRVVAGRPLTATIEAKYYFGGSVKNATIEWSAYVREDYGGWESFVPQDRRDEILAPWESETEGEESYYGGYGQVQIEGKARTDANGIAVVRLPTTFKNFASKQPAVIEFNASVKDVAGREISASASATVMPADVFGLASASEYVVRKLQPTELQVRAYASVTSKPVATRVRVEVFRTWWTQKKTRWIEERAAAISAQIVNTNAAGKGRLAFTPRRGGSYVVVATAFDSAGRKSVSESFLYASGDAADAASGNRRQALDLIVSKRTVSPGDTLRVALQTAVASADVWLTVEGQKLHFSQFVRVNNHSAIAEIPITSGHIPSLYVWAGYMKEGRLVNRMAVVRVNAPTRVLNVEVATDKSEYQPGDEVTYRVRTTDMTGSPVAAEFSLGVVDEAIYALRPDSDPDIRTFYYGVQENRVATALSAALYHSALPANSRIKERARRLQREDPRKDFRDTTFWQAMAHTDENGMATVTVRLADNLTEWRATARAVTERTAVGETRYSIKANKPLIAQLELPRFVTVGDRFHVIGVIRNETNVPMSVRSTLETDGQTLTFDRPLTQELVVAPSADVRIDWPATAKNAGPVMLTFSAWSDTESDSMRLTLDSQPYANIRTKAVSGTAIGGVSGSFLIPSDSGPAVTRHEFRFAPSLLALAVDSADELYRYPWGCIEQTTSPIIANLALLEALSLMGARLPELEIKLRDAVRASLKRVYRFQGYDGGWGWGEHSETDAYWTAYVVRALREAIRARYSVPSYRLSQAVRRLGELAVQLPVTPPVRAKFRDRSQFDWAVERMRANLHTKIFALETLAVGDPKRWVGAVSRLYERRSDLQTSGKCYLANALFAVGADAKARRVLAEVRTAFKGTSGAVYWQSGSNLGWHYGEQPTFTTAVVLNTLIERSPTDPLISQAAHWLTLQRSGRMWVSTNDTAQVVKGLARFARLQGDRPFVGTATVYLNERMVDTLDFTAESALKSDVVVTVDRSDLQTGENRWRIETNGEGNLRYLAVTRWSVPSEQSALEVHGVRVERTYLRQVRVPAKRGSGRNAYIEETIRLVPSARSAKAGEEMAVKLVVHAATALRHLVVEDPLPAGFEPIDEADSQYLYSSLMERGGAYSDDRYGYAMRQHRDDRVGLLLEDVPQGKSVYFYIVRAVTPGKFRAAPTKASHMYMPTYRGSGKSDVVTVNR